MKKDVDMFPVFKQAASELGFSWPIKSILLAMAQSKAETAYSGWGISPDPHNYGALKSSKKPPCPPGTFPYFDVKPSCFFRYKDALTGIKAFLKLIAKNAKDILDREDWTFIEYAQRQRSKGYYEIPASEYATALRIRYKEVSKNLGISEKEESETVAWYYWVMAASGITVLILRGARHG